MGIIYLRDSQILNTTLSKKLYTPEKLKVWKKKNPTRKTGLKGRHGANYGERCVQELPTSSIPLNVTIFLAWCQHSLGLCLPKFRLNLLGPKQNICKHSNRTNPSQHLNKPTSRISVCIKKTPPGWAEIQYSLLFPFRAITVFIPNVVPTSYCTRHSAFSVCFPMRNENSNAGMLEIGIATNPPVVHI